MIKKERILLYPYDINQCPIARHNNLLNEYLITSVVSPPGWGLTGLDAGCIDGGDPIQLVISDNFNEMIELCDTIVLTDSIKRLDFSSSVYPKILYAIERKKNIISLGNIDYQFPDIERLSKNSKVYYKQYFGKTDNEEYNNSTSLNINKFNTPVIFVLGVSERTNKFEIQLSIRENLISRGYRVSQIGTKDFCELYEFHSFPNFMYNVSISETNKIKLFNNFVKRIEINESPDVIVIGIPGAITRLNDIATYDFGVLAYEVSQAIKPDASILSMLYEDYPSYFSDYISNEIRYKFGFEIDCFNLANVKLDWEDLRASKQTKFITLGSELIKSKISELDRNVQPIFNIIDKNDATDLAEFLVNRLSCAEYEVI